MEPICDRLHQFKFPKNSIDKSIDKTIGVVRIGSSKKFLVVFWKRNTRGHKQWRRGEYLE